jgi:LCP family protein required for cell wall assembly
MRCGEQVAFGKGDDSVRRANRHVEVTQLRSHSGAAIAGKTGYALCCIAAAVTLVASGFAYYVKAQVDSIGGSNAISGGAQTGPMNILLMGLESRTDYQGNILPPPLLAALHAGSYQEVQNGTGGQDTNTLILLHIFAGGQKAAGISIPRDDWVTYPTPYDGQSQGKIDQAYGLAWAQSLSQTANSKMDRRQRYLLANEAGQKAAIDTVQALTGVHIDHFAEVNLAGFYGLAKATGGIEVCVKSWNHGQNLHDQNSGFNQKHAGYLHLGPEQTLAFVRERDNLPNGDLDRTHRQQAVIDYVIWKLEHQGILTSFSQLDNLIGIAKKYVITDAGWNLLNFASDLKGLTGRNLTFQTAPVVTTDGHIDGQDVNIIDPAAIRRLVQRTFYPPPGSKKHPSKARAAKTKTKTKTKSLAPGATTVDVFNGGAPPGMAGAMSRALAAVGYKVGKVGNTTAQTSTQVLYGTGAAASAGKIAGAFNGVTATASASVPAGHVELLLAPDATSVPANLGTATPSSSPSGTPSSSPSSSPTSASNNGQAGGVLTVKPNAKYGIPCVY